jgi:hypothetical protein
MAETRSLSALLSQVLVAFTVEFDNEFERRMGEAGYAGARLSLVVWANLMRFLSAGPLTVGDLAAKALAPVTQIKFELGCLERWGFIAMQAGKRPGYGSGRGIRADWPVYLTTKGRKAGGIWPGLFAEIEGRWEKRFGAEEMGRLRDALAEIEGQLEWELPEGLTLGWDAAQQYARKEQRDEAPAALATLLSRLLLVFRLEFDRESTAPLVYCANTLRVLGETPVRLGDLARLTGLAPEASDIGWQLKPYVVVSAEKAGRRGKVARLSPRGLRVQQNYRRLEREIEARWEQRFGGAAGRVREALLALFETPGGMAEGLTPPAGTVRAGDQAPALGRRDVGPAARQRMRDLVAQTQEFASDPARALPHFPAWDMNRGFGP